MRTRNDGMQVMETTQEMVDGLVQAVTAGESKITIAGVDYLRISPQELSLIKGALAITSYTDSPWAQFNRPEMLELETRLRG